MIYAKRGDEGLKVLAWQKFLTGQGFSPGRPDGKFGPKTEAATKEFQKKAGLQQDGVVGDNTFAVARELAFKPPVEGDIDFSQVEDYTVRVPRPSKTNLPGISGAGNDTMFNVLGVPGKKTVNCSNPTNNKLTNLLVIKNVGPFRVHGIRPAVDVVERVFAAVRQKLPVLYNQLGTEGMLCCRLVRGSNKNFSNHSWGTAIDIKVNNVLDRFGDGAVQLGTMALASFFNEERFFWGAGFRREDGMHFEASEELIQDWHRNGAFG